MSKQWVYIPESGENYRKAVLLASQAGLTILDSSCMDKIQAEVMFRMMPIGRIVLDPNDRDLDGYRRISFDDFLAMLETPHYVKNEHSELMAAINLLNEKQEMTNVLLTELVGIFSEGDREQEEMQSAGYQPQSLDD